jgi:hypothetical protein
MRHGGNDDAYHLPEQEFQSGKKWQMVPVMLLSRQTGEFPPIQMRHCGDRRYLPSSPALAPGFSLQGAKAKGARHIWPSQSISE